MKAKCKLSDEMVWWNHHKRSAGADCWTTDVCKEKLKPPVVYGAVKV